MKNYNNTFMVSYIFNDKAPIISLWIQSGCSQIALTLWSDRTGCAIWCLGDLTCDPPINVPPVTLLNFFLYAYQKASKVTQNHKDFQIQM